MEKGEGQLNIFDQSNHEINQSSVEDAKKKEIAQKYNIINSDKLKEIEGKWFYDNELVEEYYTRMNALYGDNDNNYWSKKS
jgi:predicted nuclease of restriction endonuclease-like (RecB) superfamily